jgi:hypothetical protein
MATSWIRRTFKKKSRPVSRTGRTLSHQGRFVPALEALGDRVVPSVFNFSTGLPDGRVATISEPPNAHNSQVEFESADDFVLNTETVIDRASFTGLLTGGATPRDVSNVVLTIYRVFPNDSDVGRTSGPPTFSTPQVPTRVNSPADNEIENFDSAARDLHFHSRVLSETFTAQNSVSGAAKINLHSGGNGPGTGEEVEFDVTLNTPLDLPAGHYFIVPKVGLSDKAPAGAEFLWLSAPRPIVPPGTPFPAGVTDLQSWMRFEPGLAPDWLRIGADVIGGTTFNASFALSGETVAPKITGLSQTSALEGSADLTITVNGSNFTSLSAVLVNGLQPLTTRLVNANQLQAILPAALLAEEGHFKLSVLDGENGFSNPEKFTVTDGVPVLTASITQGQIFQQFTLNGQVTDQATEAHSVRIDWGDGQVQVIDLGVGMGGTFSATHTFAQSGHLLNDTLVVTALDDEGVASDPLKFDVIL